MSLLINEYQRIRIRYRDGDERWLTPLAYKVMYNALKEERERLERTLRQRFEKQERCKNGHLLTGANLREYRYGSKLHRTCYACVKERQSQAKAARQAARQKVA